MTLIINNQEVQQVLNMEDTVAALEQSYLQLAAGGGLPPTYRHWPSE